MHLTALTAACPEGEENLLSSLDAHLTLSNVIKAGDVYSIGFTLESPKNLSSKREVALSTSYKVTRHDWLHVFSVETK